MPATLSGTTAASRCGRRRDRSSTRATSSTATGSGGWLDHVVGQRICTIHTLVEVCGRAWHPKRPGSCALARVLRSRPAWLKPVRSSYESRLEQALLRVGFPPLEREHPVRLRGGETVHPDLGIPTERFFTEIDHPTWHGGLDNAYDRARDLRVERAGNCVKRVPTTSIDSHLDETVGILVELRDRWLRSLKASSDR